MMTRITYHKSHVHKAVIVSNKFLVSSKLIAHAAINTNTFVLWILNQNSEIIYKNQYKNLKQCKYHARLKLKEFGAKILDETRKSSNDNDIPVESEPEV